MNNNMIIILTKKRKPTFIIGIIIFSICVGPRFLDVFFFLCFLLLFTVNTVPRTRSRLKTDDLLSWHSAIK